MDNLEKVLIDIQDKLVPILDSPEQAIYHYLFRHTYLAGKETCVYSTRSAEIGLGQGEKNKQPSMATRSKKLRSLEEKGCVEIVERSHKGISVKVLLPNEVLGIHNENPEETSIDLEVLDFYKDRRLLNCILEREGYRCFYTGRKITTENCYLDHVIPQANSGSNSYRNIVASSYDANSMKNNKPVDEFIRSLYREEIISLTELRDLKQKIEKLQRGEIQPNMELVRAVVKS